MGDLYAQLSSGAGVQFPRVVMNDGPLPPLNTGGYGSAFNTPDGIINQTKDLLSNLEPYSYGENAERLSTQTSYVNHPHRYQKIIPKIFIPSALGTPGTPDVALEHAIKEGDVVFALRMPKDMMLGPSEFCAARNLPASSLTPLVNLATVNYILYGLQVGRLSGLQHANRWNTYFLKLTQGKITAKTKLTREHVWNFIKTYIKPFGVMYGSDLQGGQHEGQYGPSNNPVDYVASFLIDGKCIKTNNLWRELNISCGDDLILLLQETNSYQKHITHVLTSGSRSFREERTSSEDAWFYLQPSIRTHKNWSSEHIHIGRSQFVFGAYTAGFGMGRVPWDARASIIGHGIQITFEPIFHDKEESLYTRKRKRETKNKKSQEQEKQTEEVPKTSSTIGKIKKTLDLAENFAVSETASKTAESVADDARSEITVATSAAESNIVSELRKPKKSKTSKSSSDVASSSETGSALGMSDFVSNTSV